MTNNFIIDRVLRGIMTKKNGEYLWSINQITNPSLNVSLTDTAQAVDALGTPIQEFDRGRSAEFGAENSIFDLSLYAAQMGKEVEIASSSNKIVTPAFEEFEVGSNTEWTLAHAPKDAVAKIYALNGDGTLGTQYTAASAKSATEFVYDAETHKITLPENLDSELTLFAMYEYEAEEATAVTADAINFPKAGKFVMEVLGTSVCDPDTLVHAYVVFPNAKLDGNVDYSFTTDGTHPFTIKAMQNYCDAKKKLFSIIIPEED